VALDASANGATIVGEADSSAGTSGFFWTSGGGMDPLPGLPGALFRTGALAISNDAATVVGYANASASSTSQLEPVRWTGSGFSTVQNLGALPGQGSARGRAYDVSPNGARIVGTTRDAQGRDVAFLWTAADGMRSLAEVLSSEYGVDVGDWQLEEARGISGENGFAEFVVVGSGTNPSGQPEGFVAVLSPTECNDGFHNDGDGLADFPLDPECTHPGDRSEEADCADGLDNDGDGQSDLADAECTGSADLSELADCGNGFDDDGDGHVDSPADPGCRTPASQSESPECDDGADNDGDGNVDTADAQCLDASDTSERLDCQDGMDNDGDGLVDFAADPDCLSAGDPAEDPACSDLVDNDADGSTDHPAAYPRCRDPQDATESAECDDGVDNDGDLAVDFPDDAGCGGPLFDVEAPTSPAPGDLLVIDRAQGTLYALDPNTGAEEILSVGAQLVAPEGIAVRADGRVVVATPDGLLEVETRTGRQDFRSAALTSVGGLPVTVDSAGHPVVLDTEGIYRVTWSPAGVGVLTALLTIPVGTDLGAFTGFTLALENDQSALTTGFGLLGDGVFRANLTAGTVSKVTPGFQTHLWRDFVFESPGVLVAVGLHSPLGEGVFRIQTASGVVTALNTDPAWEQVDGVAVGAGGTLYVADSGQCADGACSGGLVARVNPVSGARSVVRSGLFSGPLEIAIAAAPPPACGDGLDNDGDGTLDTGDPGCPSASDGDEHDPARVCDNGSDDDGDDLPDFPADPGCASLLSTLENPQCDDDLDNDADGRIDWDGGPGGGIPDPQCATSSKNKEAKAKCGLGFEIVLALPLLLRLRQRRR
jgi:hypothetical protein